MTNFLNGIISRKLRTYLRTFVKNLQQEFKSKLENLKIQVKTLQSEFDEENLKSSAERTKLEMERDQLKER